MYDKAVAKKLILAGLFVFALFEIMFLQLQLVHYPITHDMVMILASGQTAGFTFFGFGVIFWAIDLLHERISSN